MRRANQVFVDKYNEMSDAVERQTRPIRMEINQRIQMTKQLMDDTGRNIRIQFMRMYCLKF